MNVFHGNKTKICNFHMIFSFFVQKILRKITNFGRDSLFYPEKCQISSNFDQFLMNFTLKKAKNSFFTFSSSPDFSVIWSEKCEKIFNFLTFSNRFQLKKRSESGFFIRKTRLYPILARFFPFFN